MDPVDIQYIKKAGGLTINRMAKLLQVSDKTIEAWLYGYATPQPMHQDILYEMLRQAKADEKKYKERLQAGFKLLATMGAIGFLIKLLEGIPADDE